MFRWKPICGDRVEISDSLNPRAFLCARQERLLGRAAEQGDEVDFGELLDWQVGGLGARKTLAGVDARLSIVVCKISTVAHQAAGLRKIGVLIHRWHRVAVQAQVTVDISKFTRIRGI